MNISILSVNSLSRSGDNITDIIRNTNKNFNNYKFSIILNEGLEYYNDSTYIGLFENGLSGNTVIDKTSNAIHVFLNEKFKNCLIVINVKIPIQQNIINLNNVPVCGEKYSLYTSKKLNRTSLIVGTTSPTGITQYNSSLLSASNFISAFDNMNLLSEYDSGITYHYVNKDGVYGSTGSINIFNSANTMTLVPDWNRPDPPFILIINDIADLETKKQSYIKTAIKGPETNIYDKYKIYYDNTQKQKMNVDEPLARSMRLNTQENNTISNRNNIPNLIYRYNGAYEPIFKDIPLFNNVYIYTSGSTLKYLDSNYKFDTSFENFGIIEEVIYSKVNPKNSPLKLKNSTKDKSIYPMVDEFGYQYSNRFIFNSNWDMGFYTITNPEQNPNKRVFATLSKLVNVSVLQQPSQNQQQNLS